MTGSDPSATAVERLAAEFVERFLRGEDPSRTEYLARYPQWAEEINAHFPSASRLAELRLRRAEPSGSPDHLGDYRIVRELGRGGMGVVYEAEQVSLGRHVAVKVLAAPWVLDARQVQRFHREAKAAARLHHTNIVPVFGVGEQDGRHYYVMQYIDGKGLDALLAHLRNPVPTEALPPPPPTAGGEPPAPTLLGMLPGKEYENIAVADDSGAVTTGDVSTAAPGGATAPPPADPAPDLRHYCRAARLALQVAEALDYAHGQGVLHRDIKPANLLVDGRGTVWVTDFGLAKFTEQDDLTQPGEVAGTLRYAPPERFHGRSDARSDIYSLGLTLYELATLRPAFEDADQGRLLRKVMYEEPPPPRGVAPRVPRDLETVILKATARDPSHRYRTAGELAADLRLFLEDKPVLARRVGPVERLWRWCRRNPVVAGLTATAATLLALVAVVASLGYLSTRAALDREAKQYREAEANLALAVEQRSRAEGNLALSLQAFEEIFSQVKRHRLPRPLEDGFEDDPSEPLAHPVVSPEVAALLQNLLKFYDQFGERNSGDPNLRRDAARAHRRVGDLQQRLGDWDKAEAAYRKALLLYGKFVDAFPDETSYRRENAAAWNELGSVYKMTGRLAEAEDAHRHALAILTEPAPKAPAPAPYRFELVRTYTDLGHVRWKLGRGAAGVDDMRRGLRLLEELFREDGKNPSYRLVAAQTYRELSSILGSREQYKDRGEALAQAIRLLEGLDKEFPNVPDYRYELIETYAMLDTGMRSPQQRRDAEERIRKAVGLAAELTTRYPSVPDYQASLARARRKLGLVLRGSKRDGEAEKAFRDAVAVEKALIERFPTVPDYKHLLAETQRVLGDLLRDQGRLAEAKAAMEDGIANQEAFLASDGRNLSTRRVLGVQYKALADTLARLGETAAADEAARKAEQSRREFEKSRKGERRD